MRKQDWAQEKLNPLAKVQSSQQGSSGWKIALQRVLHGARMGFRSLQDQNLLVLPWEGCDLDQAAPWLLQKESPARHPLQ